MIGVKIAEFQPLILFDRQANIFLQKNLRCFSLLSHWGRFSPLPAACSSGYRAFGFWSGSILDNFNFQFRLRGFGSRPRAHWLVWLAALDPHGIYTGSGLHTNLHSSDFFVPDFSISQFLNFSITSIFCQATKKFGVEWTKLLPRYEIEEKLDAAPRKIR